MSPEPKRDFRVDDREVQTLSRRYGIDPALVMSFMAHVTNGDPRYAKTIKGRRYVGPMAADATATQFNEFRLKNDPRLALELGIKQLADRLNSLRLESGSRASNLGLLTKRDRGYVMAELFHYEPLGDKARAVLLDAGTSSLKRISPESGAFPIYKLENVTDPALLKRQSEGGVYVRGTKSWFMPKPPVDRSFGAAPDALIELSPAERARLYSRPIDFDIAPPVRQGGSQANLLSPAQRNYQDEILRMVGAVPPASFGMESRPDGVPFIAGTGVVRTFKYNDSRWSDGVAISYLHEMARELDNAYKSGSERAVHDVLTGENIRRGRGEDLSPVDADRIAFRQDLLSIIHIGEGRVETSILKGEFVFETLLNQAKLPGTIDVDLGKTGISLPDVADAYKSAKSGYQFLPEPLFYAKRNAVEKYGTEQQKSMSAFMGELRAKLREDGPAVATEYVNKMREVMEFGAKDAKGQARDLRGHPPPDFFQRVVEFGERGDLESLRDLAIRYKAERDRDIISLYKGADGVIKEDEVEQLVVWHPDAAALFALSNRETTEGKLVAGTLEARGFGDLLDVKAIGRNAMDELLLPQFDTTAAAALSSHAEFFNQNPLTKNMSQKEREDFTAFQQKQRDSVWGKTLGEKVLAARTTDEKQTLAQLTSLTKMDVIKGRIAPPEQYKGFTDLTRKSIADADNINRTIEADYTRRKTVGLSTERQVEVITQIQKDKAEGIRPWENEYGHVNAIQMIGRNIGGLSPQYYTAASDNFASLAYQSGLIDVRAFRLIRSGATEAQLDNTIIQGITNLASIIGNSANVMTSAQNFQKQRQLLGAAQLAVDQVRMDQNATPEAIAAAEKARDSAKSRVYWAAGAAFTREGLSYAEGIQREKGDTKAALALSTAGGAVEGASTGAQMGGWKGAVIGGIIGAGIGFATGRRRGAASSNLDFWREQAAKAQIAYYEAANTRSERQEAIRGAAANADALAIVGGKMYKSSPRDVIPDMLRFMRKPQFASDLGLIREVENRAALKFRPKW